MEYAVLCLSAYAQQQGFHLIAIGISQQGASLVQSSSICRYSYPNSTVLSRLEDLDKVVLNGAHHQANRIVNPRFLEDLCLMGFYRSVIYTQLLRNLLRCFSLA